MSKINESYHQLIQYILDNGYWYDDPKREGVRRKEILSATFRHEFKDGFPIISTKALQFKSVVTELIWFLRGDTNIKYLIENGCNIWTKDACNKFIQTNPTIKAWRSGEIKAFEDDEMNPNIEFVPFDKENKLHMDLFIGNVMKNPDEYGDLGPIYGHQWRNFGSDIPYRSDLNYLDKGIDQITRLIKNMIEQPLATDHIVNAWNPNQLEEMGLPPCHYGFQIVTRPLDLYEREKIFKESHPIPWYECRSSTIESKMDEFYIPKYGFELHWNQRSVDNFLGLPFNIASYALLAKIIQNLTGHVALAIEGNLKKVHLYNNSMEAVDELMARDPRFHENTELLMLDEFHYLTDREIVTDLTYDQIFNELRPDMFKLEDYKSFGPLKVEMLSRDAK